jgi:hypothetical protein
VNENFPPHIWLVFLHEVKIVHTTEGQKKEEIKKNYGKMTIRNLDLPDYWRWVEGYHFFLLTYILKFGRDSIINKTSRTTRVVDKWQGYLPRNYRNY